MRAELESAKATEQALQKRLAKSKQREKVLESERATLRKARAKLEQDSQRMQRALERDADRMRQERAALEAELIALRARVAAQAIKITISVDRSMCSSAFRCFYLALNYRGAHEVYNYNNSRSSQVRAMFCYVSSWPHARTRSLF